MYKILLTNDDGINSEGIKALVEQLKDIANITVVAPDRERSAAGHSITFFQPLRVEKIQSDNGILRYSTTGTPSDCILLALYDLMPEKPDLVISGINHGANLGHDLTYSGTVSAAMEAAIHNVPSFAISIDCFKDAEFSAASSFAKKLALLVLKKGLPKGTFLNVNIPHLPENLIKGVNITKQGESVYNTGFVKRKDPVGYDYYWLQWGRTEGKLEEDSDYAAISKDCISITPIHLTMTSFETMAQLKMWDFL